MTHQRSGRPFRPSKSHAGREPFKDFGSHNLEARGPSEVGLGSLNQPLCTSFDRADIGLIGLAVMGQNLILNMNDHGFVVCAYNRTPEKVAAFLENEAKGTQVRSPNPHHKLLHMIKNQPLGNETRGFAFFYPLAG